MNLFLQSDGGPLHFVGIGGAGMSALALVALRRGLGVTGSDADISGCGDLVAAGAVVRRGSAPELVEAARAVVVSAAIGSDHPDLVRARELGRPIVPRKEALAGLIDTATCVALAGTHGKTTTTVMTTEALTRAGLEPTGLAGGRVSVWGGNARLGGDSLFVVEADEFDQAFLTLRPTVAVINNVEADHLECYGSVEALEAAFVKFSGPARRVLIGNDGAGADRVAAVIGSDRVWRFGPDAPDVPLTDIELGPAGSRARLGLPEKGSVQLELAVPGLHNLRNAAAAVGVAAALGVEDLDPVLQALAGYSGVGRRFERLGDAGGVTLVDDYAHHPTELRATLTAARQAFPGRRLVAAFQPHLFSRTRLLADEMGEALTLADLAVVTDVYPAREQPIPGVTGRLVADAARARGAKVEYEPVRAVLADRVLESLVPGDVLLTLGAGDITQLGRDLRSRLAAR
jgi:UDP-N-acetylmuramate--alanine ligase